MQNLCFPEPPTPDTPGKGASWHYYTLISQTKIQRQAPGNWAVLNRAASRTKSGSRIGRANVLELALCT